MRCLIAILLLACTASGTAQSVYFGTLHAHTSYSDGSGTPDEAYAAARSAGMDFLAITEHNHRKGDGSGARRDDKLIAAEPHLYRGLPTSLVESAVRANDPGRFVAIFGQEISTIKSGNHINAFGITEVISEAAVPNGDVAALLIWMQNNLDDSNQSALLQFNHPRDPKRNLQDYGRDDFADGDWVAKLDPQVELIEVINGKALRDGVNLPIETHESEYLEYLNLGFHIGPSVGHDNHWRNWGRSTDARVGVIANELTKAAIMAALRARRTIASEDRNLKVIFRAGEAIGGDIIAVLPEGSMLPLTVEIFDPDEPEARYRIDVLSDHPGGERARREIESFKIEGNTAGRYQLDGILAAAPGQFVLLRITQTSLLEGDEDHEESKDRVWTAPIWFESIATPSQLPPPLVIADLLPDPIGDDLIGEEVSIRNPGALSIDVMGWQLRDLAGNVWTLSGSIGPDQTVVFRRERQTMSLNNDGDVVELVAADGTVVDIVRYGRPVPGARMIPVRD